jgi:hypothetical protein
LALAELGEGKVLLVAKRDDGLGAEFAGNTDRVGEVVD